MFPKVEIEASFSHVDEIYILHLALAQAFGLKQILVYDRGVRMELASQGKREAELPATRQVELWRTWRSFGVDGLIQSFTQIKVHENE